MNRDQIMLAAESMQNLLVTIGRGSNRNSHEFKTLRLELLDCAEISPYLPSFVTTCRDGSQFWAHIRKEHSTYQERDTYIWNAFEPLFRYLEQSINIPAAEEISTILKKFDTAHVYSAWQKAIERQKTDPEAALTSARTLLESTCKHILDGLRLHYDEKADLPQLYSSVAKSLNLSPSQHTEEIFKQILGGCHSVIVGLGSLRNRLGDAHGKGLNAYRPAPRHAALAVNLSGSMSLFLIETYEANREV